MISQQVVPTVHNRLVLTVPASPSIIERMVQDDRQERRDAFAARLKRALAAHGVPEHGSGKFLQDVTGVTAKASSKWLNAESTPGVDKIMKIAKELEVRTEWLHYGTDPMRDGDPLGSGGTVPSEKDYALIPQLSVCGENGDGYLNHHIEVKGGLAFKRDWLERVNAKPENLRVIYAKGDSMEPYIIEGDVVLLDLSRTAPVHGKPFAIRRPDHSISIKRLMQRVTGEWILSSDNPNKALYMDEEVNDVSASQVPIIGMVIWRGGAMS